MALPGWKYKKLITINNSSNSNTLTDYQVLVENPIYNETGLVGSWHFNEGSGTTAYDSSGNNNNGTLYNSPTWTTGKFGSGLSFDGVDDYVGNLGNFGAPNTFTISLWFKTTNASWDILLDTANATPPSNATSFNPVLAIKDTGVLRAEWWTGSIGEISTTFSVRDGNWHHAVFVANVNIQSLYVDGNLIGSRSGALSMTGWNYTFIGTGYDGTSRGFPYAGWHYFNGQIDEVRIYNRALSSDEIQALYNAKARLDYGDVRFIDSNGSTQLSYWQEKDGKFWVKVPSIPASSTKTIYLYYGNSSATSQSSTTNTFIREIDGGQPLKGSWSFDEGTGTTAGDSSGNNNNGTIYGATWTNSGRFGKALSFDGVNDYVEINSAASFPYGGSPRTVTLWVYTVPGSWGSNVNPFFEYGTGGTRRLFGIDMDVYPNIEFYTYGDDIFVNTGAPQEGWIFITVTYDGATTLKAYINGVLKGTKTLGGVLDTAVTNINIGRGSLANQYYIGYIDEVHIYNKALTQDEITDLYNNYGYSTTAYPGRVLVRKFSSPEPTTSVGVEEKNILLGASFLFNLV